jgi:hypothetical protein
MKWMHNSALEQAASAARPWQRAQRRQCASSGPRPVPRPPLLTASVRPRHRNRNSPLTATWILLVVGMLLVAGSPSAKDAIAGSLPDSFNPADVSMTIEWRYSGSSALNDPNPPVMREKVVLLGRGVSLWEVERMMRGTLRDSSLMLPDTLGAYLTRLTDIGFLQFEDDYTYKDRIYFWAKEFHHGRAFKKCADYTRVTLVLGELRKTVTFVPGFAPNGFAAFCDGVRRRFLPGNGAGGSPCSQ